MSTIAELREMLKNRVVLMDGATGTYYGRLHPELGEAEDANLRHPEYVTEIHRRYLKAGADVIRLNTFAVNHMLFEEAEMGQALMAAVQCGKTAIQAYRRECKTDRPIWMAASIGPIRYIDEQEEETVFEEYREICDILFRCGVRFFFFETFAEWKILKRIVRHLRQQDEEVFVLAQFSVNTGGFTKAGYSMQRLIDESEQVEGLDGFGFNCGIGVAHMNQLLSKMHFHKNSVFSVLPNAGYDHMLRGRRVFIDHPHYYAEMMRQILEKGVNIAGGCCGTTPEHIRMLAQVIAQMQTLPSKRIEPQKAGLRADVEPNVFIEKLNQGQRVYVVEIDSPFGADATRFLEAGRQLQENRVDLITISDSPMARPRAEAFEMGIYLANKTGARVMPHVCCRDRNVIALRAAMLGGHVNGIRDLLIITGDPVARDDRQTVSAVYDFNSVKLMDYVKHMNEETFGNEPFYYGGALNYAGVNPRAIAARMRKKMEAGCSYFLTQPVYAKEDIERVRWLKEETGAKIILGIMPLVSYKNALFIHNEMPGIQVPDSVMQRYLPDMSRAEAEKTALEISVEIGEQCRDFADGFYLMTPFHRVELVNRIIRRLRWLDGEETV